jgi:hypothetical protein
MTNDEPPAPAGLPPEKKTRKAPTIDLEATEIPGSGGQQAGGRSVEGEAPPPQEASAAGIQEEESAPSEEDRSAAARYRNTSIWPAAALGAAGGACFSLLLWTVNPFAPAPVDAGAIDARLARVEGGLSGGLSLAPELDRKKLDDLAGRVGKLETTTARPTLDAAAANRLSTIEGELRALSESVGILGRRSDEVATAAREARQRADAATAATPSANEAVKKLEGDLQNALSRLAAVERAQRAIETELAKRLGSRDQSGRLALAATALEAAVESGHPFMPELAAAKSLAAAPAALAPLEPFAATGVPTTAALARELSALVPQLLAAGGAVRDGSFLERLQANAQKLVRVRPLEEVQGSDAAAIVARAETKTSKGDVSGALAELETLPPAVRALAGAWMKKAQGRLAAVESSRRLATEALAGLSQ